MSKAIIVYFSAEGTTAKVSKNLSRQAELECFEIKPQVPYTEADIKMIIQDAVQEAVAALITDDEGETNTVDVGAVSGEKLTLSVQEAADLIGISKPKMFDLLHNGEIPYKRIGKKILISHQVLVEWINQ